MEIQHTFVSSDKINWINPITVRQIQHNGYPGCDNGSILQNKDLYIGDIPPWDPGPPHEFCHNTPYHPYDPYDYCRPYEKIWPMITATSGYIQLLPNHWRSNVTETEIKLSCDLPGIKPSDLSVEIDAGTLKVVGTRADTSERIERTWIVTNMFDPTTAEALLENGVLHVTLKKRPEHLPCKVKVKVK
jgi:hypothetical protein